MITLPALAAQIRSVRKTKKISQAQLAEIAGVSRSQIDRLENGRISDIGFRTLVRLLRALDLDLSVTAANQGRPTLDVLADQHEMPE